MARCLIVATLAPMLILGFGTEANARKGKAAKARPQEAPAPAPPAEAAVPPAEAGVPPAEAPAETEPVAWTEPPAAVERRANKDMKIAFSMYPTEVSDIMSVADIGEVMPPKSTWFEPKLRSGLFVHKLK
jgi:hypothetical protein